MSDLAARFRLSRAEVRIAAHLLLGHRPPQIAKRLGVSIFTIRAQLHSIFRKSGTKGQMEFVCKVARLDGWDCTPYKDMAADRTVLYNLRDVQ